MQMSSQTDSSGQEPGLILTILVLAAILFAAAALRFVGQDWDQGYHLHPDERFLSMVTGAVKSPDSPAQYFDTENSPLNPNNVGFGFFVYGDFPITLVRYIAEWFNKTDYYSNYLAGRTISALADLLTIVFTYLIGQRLFGKRAGLLAAALYAGAAFAIQQSHFFTVDTITNLFVAASLYFASRTLSSHSWLDYPLFGIALGLAMASKVSIFPLAVILILALGLRVWISLTSVDSSSDEAESGIWQIVRSREFLQTVAGLAIAGVFTILIFRVGQPYAFLPPNSSLPYDTDRAKASMNLVGKIGNPFGFRLNPVWLQQMEEVRRQVSGYSDIPPNHQWGKRLPIVFPWVNMVREGLGWPLGLWVWFAFAWAIWEIAHNHSKSIPLMLPLVWVALYFTWQGIGWVKTMRYFLPVYPSLMVLGGWALVTLQDRVQDFLALRGAPRWHLTARVATAITVLVVGSSFLWGGAVSRIYTRPVTRIAASQWMLESIASDVTLQFDATSDRRTFEVGLINNWPPTIPEDQVDPAQPPVYVTYVSPGLLQTYPFRITFDGTITGLRLNHVVAQDHTDTFKSLRVGISSSPDGSGLLAEATLIEAFSPDDDPRGAAYDVSFPPVELRASTTYYLILEPDAASALILNGSGVAVEGAWDDPVPYSMDPYNVWGAQYQGYEFEMAWEDVPDKRARMQYILDRTDYIAISSNRFYGSLTRNPQRFPLSVAYYRALFSGELGFDLVEDFTSRPNIGPLQFNDDNAEEAWTVYDHPRVLIFRKSDHYSPEQTAEVLNSVDVDHAVRVIAKDAQGQPIDLQPPHLVDTSGASQINLDLAAPPSSDIPAPGFYRTVQPAAVIIWWCLIALMGWISFPILYSLFPGLPDRGYGVSRIFGMLVTSWAAWLLASIHWLDWSAWSGAVSLGGIALVSALILRSHGNEIRKWLRDNRSHVIFVESVLLVLFGVFLLIRLSNPDLWHPSYGGEKPMDFAYFNAILRSKTFPPFDPWFEGGTINYYYFGFVFVGLPIKMLGIPPSLGYNIILPTLFAITGMGAFSAAYNLLANPVQESQPATIGTDTPGVLNTLQLWPNLTPDQLSQALRRSVGTLISSTKRRAYLAGIAALLLAVVLGNLDEIRTMAWGLAELGSGTPAFTSTLLPDAGDMLKGASMTLAQDQSPPVGLGEWYWNATRVIPVPINENNVPTESGPITEFPFFTFLYADLHAHMIALPLTLLAIVWAIAQIRGASAGAESERGVGWWLATLITGALIIGALRPTNTWDLPTYLAIGAGALALAHVARRSDAAALPALGIGTLVGGVFAAATYLLNIPKGPAISPPGSALLLLTMGAFVVGFFIGFAFGTQILKPHSQVSHEDRSALSAEGRSWTTLFGIILQVGILAVLTEILYWPYIQSYKLAYTSVIPWTGSKTPLWAYLDVLGLFLFIIVSWLLWETYSWITAARTSGKRLNRRLILPSILAGGLLVGIIFLAQSKGYDVALVALPMLIWSLVLFMRPDQLIEKRTALFLISAALSLTLAVELLVLVGDISRMNTVFKFYVQVWVMLAISAGAALGWLWPEIQQLRTWKRLPWNLTLGVLVFLASLYPLLATRAKVADRWAPDAPHTLDGMTYMLYAQRYENGQVFSLKADYEALRWLQENIPDQPVILEAQTVEYQWGSRVSVYTGLPTVLGWNWHQRQQRATGTEEVWTRASAIQEAYNTTDVDRALSVLRTYNVDLIIVGDMERAYYNAEGLNKFDAMARNGILKIIYERDGTRIYQVLHDGKTGNSS